MEDIIQSTIQQCITDLPHQWLRFTIRFTIPFPIQTLITHIMVPLSTLFTILSLIPPLLLIPRSLHPNVSLKHLAPGAVAMVSSFCCPTLMAMDAMGLVCKSIPVTKNPAPLIVIGELGVPGPSAQSPARGSEDLPSQTLKPLARLPWWPFSTTPIILSFLKLWLLMLVAVPFVLNLAKESLNFQLLFTAKSAMATMPNPVTANLMNAEDLRVFQDLTENLGSLVLTDFPDLKDSQETMVLQV